MWIKYIHCVRRTDVVAVAVAVATAAAVINATFDAAVRQADDIVDRAVDVVVDAAAAVAAAVLVVVDVVVFAGSEVLEIVAVAAEIEYAAAQFATMRLSFGLMTPVAVLVSIVAEFLLSSPSCAMDAEVVVVVDARHQSVKALVAYSSSRRRRRRCRQRSICIFYWSS